MLFYCPHCWREVPEDAATCPYCSMDFLFLSQREYVEKLISALQHPVPEMVLLAAEILGDRGEQAAIKPLVALVHNSQDTFVVKAALQALGKIKTGECLEAIRWAAQNKGTLIRMEAKTILDRIEPG